MPKLSTMERTIINAINQVKTHSSLEPGPGCPGNSAKTAVRRCSKAWQQAFDIELQMQLDRAQLRKGDNDRYLRLFATKEASIAYRNAMPLLDGVEGIRNFLACVAHGILIGAIEKEQSGSLLYAAQVALGSIPRNARATKTTIAAERTPPPLPLQLAIPDESTSAN